MNFTLVAALLCTFSWISVSMCEFHIVKAQAGEIVTLTCDNFSSFPTHIAWFRLGKGPNASRISSMFTPDMNATIFDGFHRSKFNMTSNQSTIFLWIRSVDLSDSGLYFCGFYQYERSAIVHATYLEVQAVLNEPPKLFSVILIGLTIFLIIVIISLVVKIRKHHRVLAHDQRQDPQTTENLGSDSLNYASLNFQPKTKHRPASDRELETNVVYAAPRRNKKTGAAAQSGSDVVR